jgi:type IV pilus assembly protein PilE
MSLPSSIPQRPRPGRSARGFTLIELMICVAIVGVLSSIAYPAFSSTIASTRRSDALLALMKVQLLQERFRAEHSNYGELSQLGLGSASPSRHYDITVLNPSADGYVVHASAIGSQQQDARCRHLRLTVEGLNVAYASGATEAADNAAAVNSRCWRL